MCNDSVAMPNVLAGSLCGNYHPCSNGCPHRGSSDLPLGENRLSRSRRIIGPLEWLIRSLAQVLRYGWPTCAGIRMVTTRVAGLFTIWHRISCLSSKIVGCSNPGTCRKQHIAQDTGSCNLGNHKLIMQEGIVFQAYASKWGTIDRHLLCYYPPMS